MADEEKTEEETPEEAPAEEAPVEDAPAEEAPAEDEPEAEEPAAEEEPAEAEGEADEAPADDAPAPATGDAEPAAVLGPKERRRRARSRHRGEALPERSVEERVSEREAGRRAKAAARARRRAKERAKRGEPGTGTPPAERAAGSQRVRQGIVVSAKPDKTITVRVEVVNRHRRYEKVVRRSTTVHVHDERNEANAGDTVRVIETRPMSKTKRWRLVEILERAR